MLPAECPYRLEDVMAYNPRRDREPDYDVWPPSVARVLNARLDADLAGRRARTADSGIRPGIAEIRIIGAETRRMASEASGTGFKKGGWAQKMVCKAKERL